MISIVQALYRDRATIIGTISSAAASVAAQVRAPGFLPTTLEGTLAATLTTVTIGYICVKIYKLLKNGTENPTPRKVARRRKKR